ncbi:MAG: DNA-3-methyladenine glycosylase [Myxococcales bacterium]|nr:DNA-3-methyladenine glycosylase [Myxococcales bacterium]
MLDQGFYARDALAVARDLLGKHLRHGSVVLRISEVEAYRWPNDSANHCRAGVTRRNAPMWGPPGHAYVYLCYGMHYMLNVVTNQKGQGAAVLIRACEPVKGLSKIRARRRNLEGPALLTGPGKVAQALGLDSSFSGHALFAPGGLELLDAPTAHHIMHGPRIGIGFARVIDQRAPWRLAVADSAWVSHRKLLRGSHTRIRRRTLQET